MSSDPDRWRRLIAFDAQAKVFRGEAAQSFASGESLAEVDIGRLWILAGAVARTMAIWNREIACLNLSQDAAITPARSARLISESFFDEALTLTAHGVFDAALDLALDGPPGPTRPLS